MAVVVAPAMTGGSAHAARSRIVLSDLGDFKLGRVDVSPSLRRLSHDDGRVEVIEPRVMQVLAALSRAEGVVISREDLQDSCWDGRVVSKGSLNRVISILRALAAGIGAGSFEIVTVNRVGYRLDVSARAEAAPAKTVDRRGLLIGAGGLAAMLAGGGLWLAAKRRLASAPPTVAVMPFDVAGAPGWIGPAVAREVRQSLSRISGLRAVSEASSFSLAGQGMSVAALAGRLGADLLVMGSAQGRGRGYAGRVELVDGRDQTVIWSETTAASADLATLGAQLSSLVTERLVRLIAPAAAGAALPPRRASNPLAFQHVLRAEAAFLEARTLQLGARDTGAAADEAYAQANAALVIDPGEVRALLVLWSLARNGWSEQLMAGRPSEMDLTEYSMGFVRRALLADPNDPAALAALGDQYRREWRWGEAEALLRRAIMADPGLVEARWAYGTLLGTLNRSAEGIAQARELVLLDPENASRRGYLLPRLQYAAGERKAALAGYEAMLAKGRANLFDLRELYMTYLTEGSAAGLDELLVQARALLGAGADGETGRLLQRIGAAAEALRGRPQGLLALIDASMRDLVELNATRGGRRGSDLIFLASLEYAWCGAVDPALAALERAVNARSLNWTASLPYGRNPFPAPVRSHARFAAIWKSDPRLAELMSLRERARSS